MRVNGVDFNLLTANPQLKSAFETAAKHSFEVSSGMEVVSLHISSGSIIEQFEVRVPSGSTREAVISSLSQNRDRSAAVQEQAIRSIPGIEIVSVGMISMTHCAVAKDAVSTRQACFVIPEVAQEAPQASMPADLNIALQLAKLLPGSGSVVPWMTPWFLAVAAAALLALIAPWFLHRSSTPVEIELLVEENEE